MRRKEELGLQNTFPKALCQETLSQGELPSSPWTSGGVETNSFPRFQNLYFVPCLSGPGTVAGPTGYGKGFCLPQEGHVGHHYPFLTPLPIEDSSSMAETWGMTGLCPLGCSKWFPGTN